jgi:hypothetical protein
MVWYGMKLWAYQTKIMKIIFGRKREVVAGHWRRLHNEEIRNFYASPDIIRAIKLMTMRWVDHVARMEDMKI